MTKTVEKAYTASQNAIGDNAKDLRGADYFDYLEELAAHLQCLIDCYKEEHPEDFE